MYVCITETYLGCGRGQLPEGGQWGKEARVCVFFCSPALPCSYLALNGVGVGMGWWG